VDGNKHGYGIMEWVDEEVYKGQWKENKRDGLGYRKWKDGIEYYGEYKENKLWGEGIKIVEN
jgi:hypothetical protein